MRHVPLKNKGIANYGLPKIASLLLVLLLSGCGDESAQDLWQDYQMRLSNVFAIDILDTDLQRQTWPKLPSKRTLQQQLTPPDISLWQLIKLYDCELNTLVAKRNGPMGKVMPPSQIYLYTRQFVPQAESCIAQAALEEDTEAALHSAIAFYEKHERAYRQNALFHDEWIKAHHAHGRWPIKQGFPANGLQALDYFNALSVNTQTIDESDFEGHLRRLEQARLAGNWLAQTQLATQWLKHMNHAMEQAPSLCPMNKPTEQSRIMMNVFRQSFATEVQPWISQLKRFGEAYKQQLHAISENHKAMSDFYQTIFDNPQGLWSRFNNHWLEHVQVWQQHLADCRAMPKSARDIQES